MSSNADLSKRKKCSKCENFTWLEKHHVLPKSIFGGRGKIVELCPNCHSEYHKHLGRKELKNPDENFHITFYRRWFEGLLILAVGLLLYFLF